MDMFEAWLRAMRRSTSAMHLVTVGTTTQQVIPYNELRVALLFDAVNATNIQLRLRINANPGSGLVLAAGTGILFALNIFEHGDMVRGAWFGEAGAGSPTFAYVETLLPEVMNLR